MQKVSDLEPRSREWLPYVVTTALALALLALVTAWVAGMSPPDALGRWGRFGVDALLTAGMKDDVLVSEGHVGLLVRAGAVHTSWSHLAVNALAFALVGVLNWRLTAPPLRTFASAFVMLALAVVASSAGFLASFLAGNGPSCGASAGIYGLLGALAGATWVHRQALPERLRLGVPLALTALSLGSALVLVGNPGMDHAAHLGGWGTGLLLGAVAQYRLGRRVVAALAGALLVVAFV